MNAGQKQQWLALVRKTLPGKVTAQAIAGALADRLNTKTGRLNPSHQTLANDCGFSERTSLRAVQELMGAGLVEIARPGGKGRGSSNSYRLMGVAAVTHKGKKARHRSHPKKTVRVTERAPVRVSEMADEPEGMNPAHGKPLEAASDAHAQRTYFQSTPKKKPTDVQKTRVRKLTAEMLAQLEVARAGE